ncbi:unnamed protein product [Prunus brigantina]
MRDIRLRELSSFLRTTNSDDITSNFITEGTDRAHEASAVVLHTFDALEPDVLDALSSMLPHVYTVGPLQLHLNQLPEHPLKMGYSLWKEETECLEWLNTKAPNSVVYVNFGSIVVVTPEQLVEFGWGLANSKLPFFWERILIAGWCPQEQVLHHPSVGGFLTHSGWNSTVESITAGVPMLCWPFFGDQQMDCRYTCNEWGIGMEISNDVKRDEDPIPLMACLIFSSKPSRIAFRIQMKMPHKMSPCFVNPFMGCKQFRAVVEKGLAPLQDESCFTNGYLDTVIDWIPGMRDIRLRDLPTFLQTTNADDTMFNFIMEATDRAHEASAVVLHTFDALEPDVLDALSSMLPHVYTVGPLQLHLNQIPEHPLKMGYSLWKEETECLDWLNTKAPNSVVYVNFGSIASLTAGVPMLCWPFFGDQQMDCRYTCNEWGIGMEISNDVKRDEVEKLVKELMEGEKGKKMKNKVMEWKKLAEEATGPHGSSFTNLDNLVNQVLLR